MGSETSVYGGIEFTPRLSAEETAASPFHPRSESVWDRSCVLALDDDGCGIRLDGCHGPGDRGATLLADVELFLALYGAGRTCSGRIECTTGNPYDTWGVTVRDGRAVAVEATITWPGDDLTASGA